MKQYMHVMRNMLLVALLALSASMASVAADFCWKDTKTRGVGTIPTSCTDGKEYQSGLCYSKCDAGMTGVGPVCWSTCPAGYIDMGAICHIDKALLKSGDWVCTDRGLLGECWWGYMNCDAGYTNIGLMCALTIVPTPAGFSGTFLDPMKNTQVRGAGTIPTACAADEQYDAGLCYKKCPANYSGVGPVCWGQTPKEWVGCGMGAASSGGKCGEVIFDQVASVAEVALNIATLGAGNAVTKPARFARLKKVFQEAKTGNAKFAEAVAGRANTTQGNVRTGLGYFDTANDGGDLSDAEIVALAASVASLVDPTGVSGVASSFAAPLCSALGLDLNQVPIPDPKPPAPPPVPLCFCEVSEKRGTSSTNTDYCTTWPTGSIPGTTCKYTAEMASQFRYNNNPKPGTCDIVGNPLCGGTEHSPDSCHEFDCLKPGAPTDVTAVIKGTSAEISFKAPDDGTGILIDEYGTADAVGGFENPNYLRATGKASPITVANLTAGQAYQFVVVAFNKERGVGLSRQYSALSLPSNMVGIPLPPSTNSVRPSPPTIVDVSPGTGRGELFVSFSLFNDGGSPVTGYSTTCHTHDKNGVDRSASGLTTTLTVTGLTPATFYQCSVQATNKYGTSSTDAHSLSKPVRAP